MNPLQDRLRKFIGTLDISVQEFERQCGIKAGTASRMTEKSYSTTFHRIQVAYPDLNIEWLKTGKGEMLNQHPAPVQYVNIRRDHNQNPTNYGYVNVAVPEKGKQKILNSDGIVIESEDATIEQMSYYKTMIAAKVEQISRLLAMLEEKDRTIAKLLEKI